ncbi:hypothetical protein DERF_003554 [Dermatophagoides farinae]|uniref:Uncharacterized protein n=1 Tax=Dermatophagoides farinae TaxID=6954 RepID=A0A922IDY0_DERFA|nr:hypothetical protein DERF_003554 [Dermatophagoides farinae]
MYIIGQFNTDLSKCLDDGNDAIQFVILEWSSMIPFYFESIIIQSFKSDTYPVEFGHSMFEHCNHRRLNNSIE